MSSRLNAGLSGKASSREVISRRGDPTISLTLSRCKRRLVLGETDGGGRVGGFSLMAGVKGGSIWYVSFLFIRPTRNGDDEGGMNEVRGPLVGLSYEDPRKRAISSSARPRFILGRSASEVSSRRDRMAEESREEM